MISEFIKQHKLSEAFIDIANQYYVPLAEEIKMHQTSADTPYFVGINGSQGSGKSTLSEFIKAYLTETHSLNVVVMSLDDFYFSHAKRHSLAETIHPLLQTRGVPGTHDMEQAKEVLNALRQQQTATIPRFNKATDDPHPVANWTTITKAVDIVIFEGWCWGVQAQSPEQLKEPVNKLESDQDPEAVWRTYANTQLSLHYASLYSFMDKWVMLAAPSFKDVYGWRLEQEQKLIAAVGSKPHSGLMNEQQILDFIQYYQRLTEHGLKTLPAACDHVFKLNAKRKIVEHTTKEVHE
ncbi:P-loop NTPase fold protein [Paraglaciecola sp. 2405UD69-4]|uniref:P-loop NTPase fold protein n=1 Tax=Paraglaciecola sp. 2405UD69-4 TaxID=3391836 RepID=UPI0039C9BD43